MKYQELKAYLRENRTLKDVHYGHRVLQELDQAPESQQRRQVKIGLLSSYTTDFIIPLLKTELAMSDIRCEVYKPGFNQFRQELLNPASGLYAMQPDVTIVAFGLDDLIPDALSRFSLLSDSQRQEAKQQLLDMGESLIQSYRSAAGKGALLIQDLVVPYSMYEPLVRGENGIHSFVAQLNGALRELSSKYPNTYLMEYSRLVANRGAQSWTDPRTYYTARIPVAQEHWLPLSEMYGQYIRAALNLEVKCIVLDLDNTMWGGVLGEDGFDGIALGDSYPGNVFHRFQEYLLGLYANGYILAISSKNDHDDVMDVLRRHPSMVLKEEHFASIKANWKTKEENIREISKEIQISFDHMLFVDDNLVEIEKVRSSLPGIHFLQIQSPPLHFRKQFDEARCIGKLLVTEEDRHRGQQYSDDRKRREFKERLDSINDFYRSLEQRLTVYTNHESHRARIAQLSQRTNQFNMTTFRLTEADVDRMMQSAEYDLVTADLEDRFGSSGTIAFLQVRKLQRSWIIENLLMSCRVLGRTVEERLIDWVIEKARAEGIETILATFIPTKKNTPFADFYQRNGFAEVEAGPSGEKRYMRRVAEHCVREMFVETIQGE